MRRLLPVGFDRFFQFCFFCLPILLQQIVFHGFVRGIADANVVSLKVSSASRAQTLQRFVYVSYLLSAVLIVFHVKDHAYRPFSRNGFYSADCFSVENTTSCYAFFSWKKMFLLTLYFSSMYGHFTDQTLKVFHIKIFIYPPI